MNALSQIFEMSHELRNNRFPFWQNISGTFGSIVYAGIQELGIVPESVELEVFRYHDGIVIRYNGRKRTFRNRSVNANLILNTLRQMQ